MSTVPPMRTSPPDYLTIVAAEFHEVFGMLSPQYGQPDSGIAWEAMPRSYQQCVRHTLLVLLERGTIIQNWYR